MTTKQQAYFKTYTDTFAQGTGILSTADKKKMDNVINKLNKRMQAAAHTSQNSETYQKLDRAFQNIEREFMNWQLAQLKGTTLPASGYKGILYKGWHNQQKGKAIYRQLDRTMGLKEFLHTHPELIEMALKAGTIQAENTAVENFHLANNRAFDKNNLAKFYARENAKTYMWDYIWDYLYALKHVPEIARFFAKITGKKLQQGESNNEKAFQLYNKYKDSVIEGLVRERTTQTPQMKIANLQKIDEAADKLQAAWQTGDKMNIIIAAREYLSHAGTYDDESEGIPVHRWNDKADRNHTADEDTRRRASSVTHRNSWHVGYFGEYVPYTPSGKEVDEFLEETYGDAWRVMK